MKTFTLPSKGQVSPETQVIFDQIQKRIGKVPNLYAMIGNSYVALKAFLDFETILSKGVFTAKEREVIALAASQVNECDYCLAAHTGTAIKIGFTLDDTLAIRKGDAGDPKMKALAQVVKSITINRGRPDQVLLENFYAAGYNNTALMELIGLIAIRIFTNYVYALTEIPIDFPAAEPVY